MNKNLLIVLVILVILIGGGFLFFRPKSTGSPTKPRSTSQPRNPEGVINQEVESSNYKLYSKTEYEKALAEKKVTMLYFTANWCPICREQEPVNMEALKSLEEDKDIIAFRVHILDSETTKETEALAEKYDISYQHTTVIIGPNAEVSYKYTGPLTQDDLREKLLMSKE